MKELRSLMHVEGLSGAILIGAFLIALAGCSWTKSMPVPEYGPGGDTGGEEVSKDDPLYGKVDRSTVGPPAWDAVVLHSEKQEKELQKALAPQIKRNEVIVRQLTDHSLQLATTEKSAFAKGTARIDPDFIPVLRTIANVAMTDGKSVITVFGDADTDTLPERRERLATHRGEAVRAELIRMGVSPLLISATGDPQRDYDGRIEIIMQPLVSSE